MIGRVVLVLTVVALLASLLGALEAPRPVSAQDLQPTPVGQLGGPVPLPTAENPLGGALPQVTPTPSDHPLHPLVGTWLLTFPEVDRAAGQVVFEDDGVLSFIDTAGNRGAGVWQPSGPRSGVVAIVLREEGEPGRPGQITMTQGTIDVGTPGEAATLLYTVEMVDGSAAAAERAGPFMATGQRLSG